MGGFRGINRDPLFELSDLNIEKIQGKNTRETISLGSFLIKISQEKSLVR